MMNRGPEEIGNRWKSRFERRRPTETMQTEEQIHNALVFRLTTFPFDVIAKGLSPSTFNHYVRGLRDKTIKRWRSNSEMLQFILGRAASQDWYNATDELILEAGERLAAGTAHEKIMVELGTEYYRSIRDDPAFLLQTFAWLAAQQNDTVRTQVNDLYEGLDNRVRAGFESFFESWGRELVEPYTWSEFSIALRCVFEGLAQRANLSDASVSDDLAMRLALLLIYGMTRPIHAGEAETPKP